MNSALRSALRWARSKSLPAMFLASALVVGLIPGQPLALASTQGTVPSGPPSVNALAPATDAAGVVRLWKTGGNATREAARTALLGSPEQLKAFIDEAQHAAIAQDYRLMLLKLTFFGGSQVRTKAQQALDTGSEDAMKTFVTTGWKDAWIVDDRQKTYQFLDSSGPAVKKQAQKALGVSDDGQAVQAFILTGQPAAQVVDNRMRAYQLIAAGSPSVRQAADAALGADSPEVLEDFLRYGQFVAAARDAETATIAQLVSQTESASEQARLQMVATQEASGQAVDAARMAKAATERAAQEAAAAKGSADKAGAAAVRAAALAEQAAVAADIAVNAAQEAHSAMLAAANAAANAAAATARANQAAAQAQNAAAAAASDAAKAAGARTAAEDARSAARNAQKAVDAVAAAIQSLQSSQAAAEAASSAGANANSAAAWASQASNEAGVSADQAAQSRAAAARATAASQRAQDAARRVSSLAKEASDVAETARTAAAEAVAHANNAAAAADNAAQHAGNAATAAQTASARAADAKKAADAATTAVAQARKVQETARKVDTARLNAEWDFGVARAQAAADIESTRTAAEAKAKQEAAVASSETAQLLEKLTAPGANLQGLMPEAKRALLGLMVTGGPWTRAGAEAAIASGEIQVKEFFVSGRLEAAEQDRWERALEHAHAGPTEIQIAAQEAMISGPEEVVTFLDTELPALQNPYNRQKAYQLKDAGGPSMQAAAEAALSSPDPAVLAAFLSEGRYAAENVDNRQAIYKVLADVGGTSADRRAHPTEVGVAADIALHGPTVYAGNFLQSGIVDAQRRDQEAASHLASIQGMIAAAASVAATAQANAATAAQAAATASSAAAEAQSYAAQAANYAQQAANSATEARNEAAKATQSAADAADSAKRANAAAVQARTDARAAQNSAAQASSSANNAAAAAAAANVAAAQAAASATQAGKDAQEAAAAATEAVEIATTKQREEDEAKYLQRKAVDHSGTFNPAEEAAAREVGGDAAVAELRDARRTLGEGDITDFIIREGGQLLLDFFGVTDIINCFTKGDVGACAMALVGVLPIGKIFKAGQVLGLIGKILPKAGEFFAKRQDALKSVEKVAGSIGACALNVGPASLNGSRAGPSSQLHIRTAFQTDAPLADRQTQLTVSSDNCKLPRTNPAYGTPRGTPAELGRWGEANAKIKKNTEVIRVLQPDGSRRPRIPDEFDDVNVVEVKNVKRQHLSSQILDDVRLVNETGGTLTLWFRPDTKLSKPLQDLIDGKRPDLLDGSRIIRKNFSEFLY